MGSIPAPGNSMQTISESSRVHAIESRWHKPLSELLYQWHWQENLMHKEIAQRLAIPRSTITRWFKQLHVPSQSSHRITKVNLLNVGAVKGPRAKPKIKKEFPWKFNKEFFNEWSAEMAYVLGFLCADGYVYKNPRSSCYICFISTDKEIIVKIKDALGSNHKIGIRKRKNKAWKTAYVLQIGSKDLFEHLNRMGIVQNKSLVIPFPLIPAKFLAEFVRGYFDGDGGVHLGKYWRKNRNSWYWEFSVRFTSGSKKFLEGLWKALRPYTQGGFLGEKGDGSYELQFSRHDGKALFYLMYKDISSGLYLKRKYQVFLRAFQLLPMQP